MSKDTREKILAAGADLIHRQGFNHTGISEVLKAAGVPKGSFYFYFKSKEDFGLQVVDWFGGYFRSVIQEYYHDESQPYLVRLRSMFERFLENFKKAGLERGCPVGNLAQEMSDLSPAFRDKLDQAILGMVRAVEKFLAGAREAGELEPELDINEMARFVVSSWEGCLILMKVQKSARPMELFDRMIFDRLLK